MAGLDGSDVRRSYPIAQINYDSPGIQVATDGAFESLDAMMEAIRTEPKGSLTASGTGQGGIWHLAFAGFFDGSGYSS
ncbi:hypothetical protein HORIV_59390 [Vreelandella olivaria]|uniref:Uncharacterized protein n=1 Tax=Vreelandella olivaria TaxID=390919 RepID=A0ABM7GP94_9GAMM|nr:hypothetical protein HORIV_59390 [Halomonas olivaria]